MLISPQSTPRSAAVVVGAAILVLVLSACTPTASPSAATSTTQQAANGLPRTNVHGLAVRADTGQVLLATHDGLFDVTKQPATKIGGTNDLMGFTAGKDSGLFYASGHSDESSDLPNPLGLIRSTDGGETWEQLSRQGESAFHALTTTKSGIVACDGALSTSPDGETWRAVGAGFTPAVLVGHPDGDTVLATTPDGIRRSTDGGAIWAGVTSAPALQFAAFADPAEAVGVEADGTVHYSADAGVTWTKKGRIGSQVLAMTAVRGATGNPWIWAATPEGVIVSTDGGITFRRPGTS